MKRFFTFNLCCTNKRNHYNQAAADSTYKITEIVPMRILILILFCVVNINGYSQAKEVLCDNDSIVLKQKADSLFTLGTDSYNAGKYEDAIRLDIEALNIYERVYGTEHPDYVQSLNNLANYYSSLGNYSEAIRLGTEALKIREKVYGTEHPDYAQSLNNLAYYYSSIGNYTEAIRSGTEALNIYEKVYGTEHPHYATSLSGLAQYNYFLGNYSEAIRLGTEVLKIREKVYGTEHPDYAQSLNNLANYYSSLGNYSEAIRLGTKALNIYEKVYGTEHPHYATSLNNLAVYYSDMGNYFEAIRLDTEVLKIREKVYGTEHPDYAQSLNNLANDNSELGNYSEAIRLGTEALNIVERLYGKGNMAYAISLNNLANYYYSLGNYSEAIRLGTQALNIIAEVYGTEHPDYATSLNNLAAYYSDLGNYTEAIRLDTEALKIREKVYGTEHPDYASSLNNLAARQAKLGNFTEAIRLGTEALKIREKVYGTEHPDYASSISGLANYYSSIGNYAEAIRLFTEALKIREKVYGTEHPDYASSLQNLANYYSDQGNYTEAIRLDTEALRIREKVYGTEHPDYATSLNNLALSNCYLGNYSEAIRLGTEALKICEKVYGTEHPNYASSLSNIAAAHYSLGNYSEAIRLDTEALNIYEKVYGTEHPKYATFLQNLAFCYFASRDIKSTSTYSLQYSELVSALIRRNFAELTSSQRRQFWEKNKSRYEEFAHIFSYVLPSDTLTMNGYNSALLSKGLLLNSDIEFSKLIQETGDSEIIAMYDDLRTLRLQIDRLLEKPVSERFASVDSLERIVQAKEQALIDRSKVYGNYTDNLIITWNQVQEKLSDKDIAVEFVSFPLNADSTMYIAYTLRKDWEYPRMIPLFEEKQLKKIYFGEYYTTTGISGLVWQPLEEVLQGVETVFFAPSGELYNIAIESVPDYATNGETIVSDSRTYYRLSSTRELVLKRDKDNWKDAAVYGGLTYGMNAASIINNSRSFSYDKTDLIAITGDYYSIADTLMRAGLKATELDGTRQEALVIDSILNISGIAHTLYMDSVGTESSFKKMSGKKVSIMHIGTHGFYWTEQEAKKYNYDFLLHDDQSNRYVEDKQLTRSGLLFAGANYSLSANREKLPEDVDDGVLTAKELTSIDLRGLDLVVLSACQTGLGEITGDGVFGLQRGFKKAGAQTIIMSLWKVNDKATELFMTKFFEEIKVDKNGHPINKHEAFLAAQNYLRTGEAVVEIDPTEDDLYYAKKYNQTTPTTKRITLEDPKYWAAFIMLDGID